ncbi:hypothetical protein K7X08_035140 [Anisodus acutangulus]|uniref:AP2/ERF domain-containing protein n=1 Tax=Anisodus acutangulus TaxID=402998 RepID=A0A9Q1LH11_9SOLA|nr:hypothetical protein K7X08_035140 [Anisodus acutangulus]
MGESGRGIQFCELRKPNKKSRIWLDTFPTAAMAARAHDVAALAIRGRSVCLNFPDSAWRLPIPASSDSKDIQKAAAEAAEAFRSTKSERVSGESSSTPETPEMILASNNPKKPAGRKKFQETRHPIYRGVRKRNSGKWVCEVREPNKKSRIWLGTYPTVEMAARAHDVAALALRGHSACLNFEDSVWRLPIPASSDTKDIQKAASEAAEAFRPLESEKVSGESGNTLETPENMFFMNEEAPESRFFMDEEALFYMPGLLADMAEGLMLPPPQCLEIGDHAEVDANMSDMSLWSYSI